MLNNILYTGTGIAVAGLSAAYYYIYSSRINENAKHVESGAIDSSSVESSLDIGLEDSTFEISDDVVCGGGDGLEGWSDADTYSNFSTISTFNTTDSEETSPSQTIDWGRDWRNSSKRHRHHRRRHSTPRMATSPHILRLGLPKLNASTGSKHGLNIDITHENSFNYNTSSSGCQSLCVDNSHHIGITGQIVSRAEFTSAVASPPAPSRKRELIRKDLVGEINPNGASGDHKVEVSAEGLKLTTKETVPDPEFIASAQERNDHPINPDPTIFKSPMFGQRYAYKNTEMITEETGVLQNSKSGTHNQGYVKPSKIPRRTNTQDQKPKPKSKSDKKSKLKGLALANRESFERVLQEKRRHLRPIGEKKSEEMISDFQCNASVQTDPPDLKQHEDNTLLPFPSAISEFSLPPVGVARIDHRDHIEQSGTERLTKEAQTEQCSLERANVGDAGDGAHAQVFDLNHNDGSEEKREVVETEAFNDSETERKIEDSEEHLNPIQELASSETIETSNEFVKVASSNGHSSGSMQKAPVCSSTSSSCLRTNLTGRCLAANLGSALVTIMLGCIFWYFGVIIANWRM